MNEREALNLVGIAVANFPAMQERDMRPTAALWAKMLADVPYSVGEQALMYVLTTARFFPTVAEIREAVVKVTTPCALSPAEAWGEVELAIRCHGSYGEADAMRVMPPGVAVVARQMGWRDICVSENIDVVRGQFLRMYEIQQRREQERAMLPDDIRGLIDKIGRDMLPDGGVASGQ